MSHGTTAITRPLTRDQNRGRQGVPHQRDSLEIEPQQKQDQERGRGGARTPDEEPIGDDRVGEAQRQPAAQKSVVAERFGSHPGEGQGKARDRHRIPERGHLAGSTAQESRCRRLHHHRPAERAESDERHQQCPAPVAPKTERTRGEETEPELGEQVANLHEHVRVEHQLRVEAIAEPTERQPAHLRERECGEPQTHAKLGKLSGLPGQREHPKADEAAGEHRENDRQQHHEHRVSLLYSDDGIDASRSGLEIKGHSVPTLESRRQCEKRDGAPVRRAGSGLGNQVKNLSQAIEIASLCRPRCLGAARGGDS